MSENQRIRRISLTAAAATVAAAAVFLASGTGLAGGLAGGLASATVGDDGGGSVGVSEGSSGWSVGETSGESTDGGADSGTATSGGTVTSGGAEPSATPTWDSTSGSGTTGDTLGGVADGGTSWGGSGETTGGSGSGSGETSDGGTTGGSGETTGGEPTEGPTDPPGPQIPSTASPCWSPDAKPLTGTFVAMVPAGTLPTGNKATFVELSFAPTTDPVTGSPADGEIITRFAQAGGAWTTAQPVKLELEADAIKAFRPVVTGSALKMPEIRLTAVACWNTTVSSLGGTVRFGGDGGNGGAEVKVPVTWHRS
ncbi:hypothetical protein [Streptomyces wedmorensis]|uniref:hypothetical protein n=1 Tax=Streptomyces wedmorensis TaxID=43759 RepID=UPI00378E3D37